VLRRGCLCLSTSTPKWSSINRFLPNPYLNLIKEYCWAWNPSSKSMCLRPKKCRVKKCVCVCVCEQKDVMMSTWVASKHFGQHADVTWPFDFLEAKPQWDRLVVGGGRRSPSAEIIFTCRHQTEWSTKKDESVKSSDSYKTCLGVDAQLQRINTSKHQHINTPIQQHTNTNTSATIHQHINTSAHQHAWFLRVVLVPFFGYFW
jgi:hypothetical protein